MTESPFLKIPSAEYITANDVAFAVYDKFPVSNGHARFRMEYLAEFVERSGALLRRDSEKAVQHKSSSGKVPCTLKHLDTSGLW
jgi:hypothetical protein